MTITVILIVILFSFIIVHHIYKVKDKLDEQFKTSNLTYTFSGVNISRMKVLRNRVVLNEESNLIDSLIYGSILNQQEYNIICDEVNAKKLKKEI